MEIIMYGNKNHPSLFFPLNLLIILLVLSGCSAGGGGVGRDGNAEGGKININLGLGEAFAPYMPPSANQTRSPNVPSCGDPYCKNPAHYGTSSRPIPSCGNPNCSNPAHYGSSPRPMIPLCGNPYCSNPAHYGPAP